MPSTVIARFDYDAATRELQVTFTSGLIYTYYGVPSQVHDAFRDAFSRGEFFNRWIKDRYDFRRHVLSA